MQIPDFQPSVPGPSTNDPATPLGPRRTNVSGAGGNEGVVNRTQVSSPARLNAEAAGAAPAPSLDPADALDSADISTLSQAILKTPDVAARVESLEKLYSAGNYRVNPKELARTIVQTYLAEEKAPRPDPPAESRKAETPRPENRRPEPEKTQTIARREKS